MLTIDDDVLKQADISADDLRKEIVVYLYQKGRFSFGQARKLSGLTHYEFQCLLNEREVPLNYSVQDLHDDVALLRKKGMI